MIRTLAEIRRDDENGNVRTKLSALTDRLNLPEIAAVGLARLMGVSPPAGEVEEMFWAFRSAIEAIARQAPLVVVFEDLHWADDGLLELVEHVADWSSDAPLLLIATARPDLIDRCPAW